MNEYLIEKLTVYISMLSCLKKFENRIFSISVHTEQVFVFRNVIHNVKSFKGSHV